MKGMGFGEGRTIHVGLRTKPLPPNTILMVLVLGQSSLAGEVGAVAVVYAGHAGQLWDGWFDGCDGAKSVTGDCSSK